MTTTPDAAGWRAANRANWDERVPVHVAGDFYDLPGFVPGRDTLRDFELTEIGETLGGRTFDIVYTGFGALCRLPDIAGWAQTAAKLVAPGGFLYLAEFHPVADVLADDGRTIEGNYFQRDPIIVDAPGTYADPNAPITASLTVEWLHGIGEVVSALAAAGLRLEFLHEHDSGHFRFPAGLPVPQVYSLRAVRIG